MPRCHPILPTPDDPFPIHNPCAGVTCPKGQRCLAPNDMPRCFPVWPPPDDFPFLIERRATVPDHIASCPRDLVCPEGQFCLELNGTPKCIAPKPVLHSTGVDLCRFKICNVDEFCEMVGRTAKCTPFSTFTPGPPDGMPTATTPTLTPDSEVEAANLNSRSNTCAIITCADGYHCEEEGPNGIPACVPSSPTPNIPGIIIGPDSRCWVITCRDGLHCEVVDGVLKCVP